MPARVAVEPKVRSSTIAPAETPGHREFKHSSSRPAAAAVVHQINKARTSWFANLVPYLLSLRPSLVLVNGAVLYTCLCALFAGIYFSLGEACFATDEEFTFAETFWLSVHTFTTVGYGSIYPTCTSGQLVVMFESYISLVVTSVMGGRILFEVMRPRSRVRFSNVMLLDQSECGTPVLTFRMARECGSLLRDAKIQVQARFVWHDASGSTQGRRETLMLRSSEFSQLEQWQVYHSIDGASPLLPLLGQLNTQLTGLEVSLVAFDTSYMQEVRLYVTYKVPKRSRTQRQVRRHDLGTGQQGHEGGHNRPCKAGSLRAAQRDSKEAWAEHRPTALTPTSLGEQQGIAETSAHRQWIDRTVPASEQYQRNQSVRFDWRLACAPAAAL